MIDSMGVLKGFVRGTDGMGPTAGKMTITNLAASLGLTRRDQQKSGDQEETNEEN
jgi:hypothetical protein